VFRESANYSTSLPTSPSLVKSGKLKVIQDEGNVYYFTFVTENHDDTEIHIHKLMEINYSTNTFSAVLSNYIQITSHLFDHELFSGINYDESTKIFGIHNDYSYGKSIARVNHFINWDLNYQLYSHDSNVPYHFYDFVKNTDKLLMANLWEDNGFFYVRGICTVPYSVVKYTIETHLEEEECMEGGLEFDRAGTWVDEKGAIYIISEKDN
jgi:outer membrane receptor protein involved in Fe transport